MTNDDADALINCYLDGTASEEEVTVLSEMLEGDAQARARYLRLAWLHASLASGSVVAAAPETECIACSRVPLPTARDGRPDRRNSSGFRLLAAGRSAVDLMLGVLSALLVWACTGARHPRVAGHGSQDESRPQAFGAFHGVRLPRSMRAVAAGAALVLVLLGLGRRRGPDQRPVAIASTKADTLAGPIKEPRVAGFAIVTRAVDAIWEGGGPALAAGSVLSNGVLRFRSGVLQLEFYSGATVVLEGPAEIELKAIDWIACRYGKLRALVPFGAHGFRVDSPSIDLVDLGTEFGMRVTPDRKTEVHVFDGKVELHNPNPKPGQEAPWELAEGKGLRIGLDGDITPLVADSPTFMTPLGLAERYRKESGQRYAEWTSYSRARVRDRRLIAYFSFEGDRRPGSRVLVNQGDDRAGDGTIVGCEWVDGRWPGKGALEFKRPADRVRINIPGEFQSLTFATWVRIDSLEKPYNSLMLTDGFDHGETHWHIDHNGRIGLGVRNDLALKHRDYASPSVITPQNFGRWIYLATVYDQRARRVTHYMDGVAVSSEPITYDVPLRIGKAELGNWGALPSSFKPIRNLCGRMDEFALFREALSAEEIGELYRQGNLDATARPPSMRAAMAAQSGPLMNTR